MKIVEMVSVKGRVVEIHGNSSGRAVVVIESDGGRSQVPCWPDVKMGDEVMITVAAVRP